LPPIPVDAPKSLEGINPHNPYKTGLTVPTVFTNTLK
jgi:hypothetical protein